MYQSRNLYINIFMSILLIIILVMINIGIFSLFFDYKSMSYYGIIAWITLIECLIYHRIALEFSKSDVTKYYGISILVMLIIMGIGKIIGRVKKLNSAKYSVYALCENNVVNVFYFNKFYFLMSNNDIQFSNDEVSKEKIINEIELLIHNYGKKPEPQQIDMFKNWNGSLDDISNRKTKISKIIK